MATSNPKTSSQVQVVAIGSPKRPERLIYPSGLITANVTLPTVAGKIITISQPETDETNGLAVLPVPDEQHARMSFFGTNADNETITALIFGVDPVEVQKPGGRSVLYRWTPLLDLAVTLGATAMSREEAAALGFMDSSTPSIGDAEVFWADTITITNDYNATDVPAIKIEPGSAAPARLWFDHESFTHLAVYGKRGTAASFGGLIRFV